MLLVHLIISFMGIMDQEFKSWFYIPSKSYDGKIYTLTQFLEYGLFQVANLWCFCNPDQHTITGNFFYNQPCHIKVQTIFFFLSSLRPCCFMLVNLNCSFGKLSMKRLIFLHFAANSPPQKMHFFISTVFFVSAERPEPQLARKLDGSAVVQRKQARVRKESEGLCWTVLVRRLDRPTTHMWMIV